jgi:D-alanine-D-alanine ligase-like ATP-grasp enzyme
MPKLKENYFVLIDSKYININYQIIDLVDVETATDNEIWCAAEDVCECMGGTDLCASELSYPI